MGACTRYSYSISRRLILKPRRVEPKDHLSGLCSFVLINFSDSTWFWFGSGEWQLAQSFHYFWLPRSWVIDTGSFALGQRFVKFFLNKLTATWEEYWRRIVVGGCCLWLVAEPSQNKRKSAKSLTSRYGQATLYTCTSDGNTLNHIQLISNQFLATLTALSRIISALPVILTSLTGLYWT